MRHHLGQDYTLYGAYEKKRNGRRENHASSERGRITMINFSNLIRLGARGFGFAS